MKRKRNNFKFTKKTHSKRGIRSCMISMLSVFVMGYLVLESFRHGGQGNVYLGSAGFLMMIFAIISFVMAVRSLGEEDSFRLFPVTAMILSVIAVGAWGAVYAAGFLLV